MGDEALSRLIGYIRIEALCHGTEDPNKVLQAISHLVGRPDPSVKTMTLQGHYDNPILLMTLVLDDSERIVKSVETVVGGLGRPDKKLLAQEISDHLDEKENLHLRFDKQLLYEERLALTDGDDVVKMRVNLAPHVRRKYESIEVYRLCGFLA